MIESALRAWRSDPSEASLRRLEGACERAGQPLPWDALAATPRWRWLRDLSLGLCAEPLGPDDGEDEDALSAREASLGIALPLPLREWLRLIGRRVEVSLGDLSIARELAVPGVLPGLVISADSGAWTAAVLAEALEGSDPAAELREDSGLVEVPRLSQLLCQLTVEGSFDAWSMEAPGPLGELCEGAEQGWDDIDPASLSALTPLPGSPWRRGSAAPARWYVGEALLLYRRGGRIAWLASAAARDRLEALTGERGVPRHELVLGAEGPEPSALLARLMALGPGALSEGLQLRHVQEGPESLQLNLESGDPAGDVARLRAAARPATLTARSRPLNRSRWEEH